MRGRRAFRKDVQRAYERFEGGTISRISACISSPGLYAVAVYRFGSWLLDKNLPVNILLLPIYLFVNFCVKVFLGIRIGRQAIIGEGLVIGGWRRIFISGLTVIGRNCDLLRDVSIVTDRSNNRLDFPIIGDNVQVGPGVRIHGRVYVGNNVRVAPDTTVDCNIPDNALVRSAPPHIVRVTPLLPNIAARRAV